MAKQRATKYDKKVKLNVSFHDAVNILMNKGKDSLDILLTKGEFTLDSANRIFPNLEKDIKTISSIGKYSKIRVHGSMTGLIGFNICYTVNNHGKECKPILKEMNTNSFDRIYNIPYEDCHISFEIATNATDTDVYYVNFELLS